MDYSICFRSLFALRKPCTKIMKGEVSKAVTRKRRVDCTHLLVHCSTFFKCFFFFRKPNRVQETNREWSIDLKTAMDDYTTDLPEEVSVEASHQSAEIELIHRSQAGDTEAFGELVTKYRATIFNMVYAIVGNEYDAWDLAQEG